jgi:outer membrane lipoprotein carrier protein
MPLMPFFSLLSVFSSLLKRLGSAQAVVLVGLVGLSLAAHAGQRELSRFMDTVNAAQGRFEQVVHSPSARLPQTATGQFVFERPGRFRWEYQTPYTHLLLADGQEVWSFDPDLNQVTVQALGDALGQSPAAILSGKTDLEANFILEDEGITDGLSWINARPRGEGSHFLSVRLGFKPGTAHLVSLWLEDHFGQKTELRLQAVTINPRLDPGLFRFTPPPGADVLRQ